MAGEGDVRHCGACGKDVVDLSALTRREARARIERPDPPCVRIRHDARGRPIHRRARLAVLGLLLSGQALAAPDVECADEGWLDWAARRVREWWNPTPARPDVVGAEPEVDTGGRPIEPEQRREVVGKPAIRPREPVVPAGPPGPLSIALADGSPPFTSFEVVCSGLAFRQRAAFDDGRAILTIPDTPECRVFFKGGPPVSTSLRPGDYVCSFVGTAADCTER